MKNQQFALASLSIIIFLTSSCLVSAEQGSCPVFSPLFQWKPKWFDGTWYLYGTDVAAGNPCQRMELTYNSNDNAYAMTEYGSTTKKGVMNMVGSGKFTLEDGTALAIYFINQSEFALVRGCKNSGSGTYERTEYIWTRAPQPNSSVIKRIKTNSHTPLSSFKLTNQKNCQ